MFIAGAYELLHVSLTVPPAWCSMGMQQLEVHESAGVASAGSDGAFHCPQIAFGWEELLLTFPH